MSSLLVEHRRPITTNFSSVSLRIRSVSLHIPHQAGKSTVSSGGEARDVTGLDYLRARYYDSQTGTFLTADSYQGSRTDPLSHNLYTYVQNNPANYTDPSGHYGSPFAMMDGGRGRPVRGYSQPKPLMNPTDGTLYAPSTPEHRVHQVRQQQTQIYSYNYTPSHNAPRTSYQQTLWQQAQAQRSISNAWEQAKAIGQSVYDWGASRTREAANIARNWTKSLEETITHVCTTAERWVQSVTTNKTNIRVVDFHKIEEANKYGLTVAEKTKIDTLNLNELGQRYPYLRSINPYQGVSASDVQSRPYIISRYNQLLLESQPKPLSIKDNLVYAYYDQIISTGVNPYTGKKATELELIQARIGQTSIIVGPIVDAFAAGYGYPYRVNGDSGKTISKSAVVNADDIRFSQSSVNGVKEIAESMKKYGWLGEPIDIVEMPDGKYTTIDNTRVVAARDAGISVQANIHHYTDALPEEFINRFTTKQGVPSNWGEAVELRIKNQSKKIKKSLNTPYGSNIQPKKN
ncbi:RHS repeat-associated core domain-containing protein [Streptococcus ruminantium]|uniref:RHS repeat-associated core domain-containing protein n=1 Tax=Streptococcus ruminantium TaxID=1917441 RepID=UPI001D1414D8|nr:RHS repeat-associated core domain-containing protein [Streptococcus ruminantium]